MIDDEYEAYYKLTLITIFPTVVNKFYKHWKGYGDHNGHYN